jgi:predicted phosphoribosyltransferase
VFVDRIDAAQRLARVLAQFHRQQPLVLAIARGAAGEVQAR